MAEVQKIKAALVFLIVLALPAIVGAQTPGGKRIGSCEPDLARDLYRFCFDGTKWTIDEAANSRFTNRDRIEVEVRHFNFLRYTLSFDVKEEKSESYQYLTKLWTSVLSPDIPGMLVGLGGDETTGSEAEKKKKASENALFHNLRELARRTEALDRKVTSVGDPYTKTGLTDPEAKELVRLLGHVDPRLDTADCREDWPAASPTDPLLQCLVWQVIRSADAAYSVLERGVATDDDQYAAAIGRSAAVYRGARDAYRAARDRADKFVTLAEKTVGVELKQVGKRDAGTRVMLTLAAVDGGGARTPVGDVNYFVETTMPLVFHGGLAFSSIRDVTFEKIQRASGFGEDDLFQQKSDSANSKSFSIFFGWQVTQLDRSRTPNNSRTSLLISLGTDIASPGQKIFAGPSLLLFNRIVLTSGWAFGKEAHGEQQTLEPDLFKIIKQKPTSAWFFSFTSKVH